MKRLVFGCGYLGCRVARRWLAAGDEVVAVTRSVARYKDLHSEGFQVLVADVTAPMSLVDTLPCADTVLFAVGMDRSADHSILDLYAGGLRHVLDALPAQTGNVIYISSTGVYGQVQGEWVDESDVCEPLTEGGRACLHAEKTLWAHALGSRGIVLRLAGIYGPNRVPRQADLRDGKPIVADPTAWLNLIHVDDAAAVVAGIAANADQLAGMDRSASLGGYTWNVADGCPVRKGDFYAEFSRRTGCPLPSYQAVGDAEVAPRRGLGNKRISNRRLMHDWPVTFAYPTYREGLAAIVGPR
ncbi:MAG: NAD-dependent epimerase/dehydratase family protein [Planctomycetales bacterium]|nr:NAD-dependent epimerase/dehydratase family protein [Planctomycetales bacterium]